MLFTAMMKTSTVVALQLFPHAAHHATDILNKTPNSSSFSPKEIFTGAKSDRHFMNFHAFGSPVFALDPTTKRGRNLATWSLQSIPSAFIGKLRECSSNMSFVYDPATRHVSHQFQVAFDDDFQTVSSSGINALPLNWKEEFEIDHHANDTNFGTPLEVKANKNMSKVSARFSEKDADVPASNYPVVDTIPLVSERASSKELEGDSTSDSSELN